ncbi:MAG TPA: HAD family hydrolase [Bryobacteraceae bacterium]|nr:HAD family hydrolase [Bryobacteraceae bacterium]
MAPALVLFDIDGTLIRRAGPHHREALVEAVRRVTGFDTTTEGIPVQGMLDGDILAEMMRRAGARPAQIRRAMPRVFREAQAVYEASCPGLVRKRCPGARAALRRLERAGVLIGLVTGNLSRIAWKKTQQAGIADFFRFGAFAEMGHSRAELVRKAASQARREGWIGRGAPVSLVGDHPNDILAARANCIRSIAVATGVVPAAELAAHHPDLLLEDLHKLTPEMVLE